MLKDIKDVIVKPVEAFDRIKERGTIFVSFILYFLIEALSIILSFSLAEINIAFLTLLSRLVSLPLAFFLWTGIIHLISTRYSLDGSYKNLLSVWGYTTIPSFFLSLLAFPLLIYLYFDHNLEKSTLFIFAGSVLLYLIFIAVLIWSIILLIIAIRIVYKFTLKRVFVVLCIFFIIASIFESIFVSFNETFLFQLYPPNILNGIKEYEDDIFFTKDKVTYLFRKPKIGDEVIFVKEEDINKKPFSICLSIVDQSVPLHSWIIGGCKEYMGKIEGKEDGLFIVFHQKKKVIIKKEQIKGRVCNFVSIKEMEEKWK